MGKRNRNLLIAFVVLVIANLIIAFTGKVNSGVSFDERKFTTDPAGITSLKIDDLSLKKNGEAWIVNDQYKADPAMIQLLQSIMQRVEVKKPVSQPMGNGTLVSLNEEPAFSVQSNATKTKTYFSEVGSEESFEVHIPGYNEYLGGIFELAADQWRDRLILDASWRTIQNLKLNYASESKSDFEINFEEDFFSVAGVSQLDSNKVVDYLNQFQVFQVNEWISEGRFARYDSLAKTPAIATLAIETINQPEVKFEIFGKLPSDRFYLVCLNESSLFVVDERRMKNLLREKAYFSLNE